MRCVSGWELRESFETEDGSVRFDRFGEGPPLVMLHGTPFSSVVWRHLVSRLCRDWTIFVWDLLGYGASDQRAGQDVSIAAQTRVFGQLLDHWAIDSPAVVAHDIGGAIALRAHLLDARPYDRLALIDPVALAPWGSPFFRLVQEHAGVFERIPSYMHEAMVVSYIRNASHVPLDDDVLDAFSRPWLGDRGQAAFYRQIAQADERFTNEVQPRYGEIRVPVLIIWGEEDRWIDVTQAHVLGELIGGAEVTVVPAAGHLVQEDAPDETARHLARFLLDRRRAAD
jgi:pimeloyl-ACP methyl ester carboxylesterase